VRKQLLEYDDVANDQRKVLYAQRNEVLEAQSISETIDNLRNGTFTDLVARYVPAGSVEEQWDIDALQMALEADWQIVLPLKDMIRESKSITEEDILEKSWRPLKLRINRKFRRLERSRGRALSVQSCCR